MKSNEYTYNHKHSKRTYESTESSIQTKFIVAACVCAIGLCAVPLYKTISNAESYKQEFEKAKATNQQAVENNRLIQEEYQRVNDPDYLADVARRDYYYTKSGEIIFVLPEEVNQ